jgi:hypothetical protein
VHSKCDHNMEKKILYKNGRSFTLWIIWIIAIGLLLLTIWLASLLTDEQIMNDFGSITSGRIFQFALVFIGSVFIWPMLWMSNRYVISIESRELKLFVTCWTILGNRTQPITQSDNDLQYNNGKSDFSTVNAPYLFLRINNRKVIIDLQGEFPHGEDALVNSLTS